MTTIRSAAPQLLVEDLERSLDFYRERLGFMIEFVYEGFYASVARDGARLHLKCAPKLDGERAHRKQGEHLDAHLDVTGLRGLAEELGRRGAPLHQPLGERSWGVIDLTVEDPDGYLLCFSEPLAEADDDA